MEKTNFIDNFVKSLSQTFNGKSIEQLEISNALLDNEITKLKKRMDELEEKIDILSKKKYVRKIHRSKLSRYCDNKLDISVSVEAVDILEERKYNQEQCKKILTQAIKYAKRENAEMILGSHIEIALLKW